MPDGKRSIWPAFLPNGKRPIGARAAFMERPLADSADSQGGFAAAPGVVGVAHASASRIGARQGRDCRGGVGGEGRAPRRPRRARLRRAARALGRGGGAPCFTAPPGDGAGIVLHGAVAAAGRQAPPRRVARPAGRGTSHQRLGDVRPGARLRGGPCGITADGGSCGRDDDSGPSHGPRRLGSEPRIATRSRSGRRGSEPWMLSRVRATVQVIAPGARCEDGAPTSSPGPESAPTSSPGPESAPTSSPGPEGAWAPRRATRARPPPPPALPPSVLSRRASGFRDRVGAR